MTPYGLNDYPAVRPCRTTRVDPFSAVRSMTLVATLSAVVLNADGFAEFLTAMYNVRCQFCGYRFDHPIVTHDIGYNSKECGWR